MRVLLAALTINLVACVYGFNDVHYETVGTFSVFSIDNEYMNSLDNADSSWIRGGFQGLSLTLNVFETSDDSAVLNSLAAPNELVYISSHGGGGGIALQSGNLSPFGYTEYGDTFDLDGVLEVNARFVVLAACLAGRANWEMVLEEGEVEGIFAYTEETYDILDNDAAIGYVQCIGRRANEITGDVTDLTSMDHHLCWKESNENVGGLFNSWVSIIKDSDTGEIVRLGGHHG